jgi:hypothetical protein
MTKRTMQKIAPGLVFTAALAVASVLGTIKDERGANDAKDAKESITPDPCVHAKEENRPRQGDAPSPLEVDSRLHGCQKVSYSALRNFLVSRGVDPALASTPDSAGELYNGAKDTFGVPPVDSRTNERSFHTTAEATKLFDIFLRAAPEIVANMNNSAAAPACVMNGTTKPMFADDNTCVMESVSCLLGRPAEKDDMTLCNAIVQKADPANTPDLTNKKYIAVATLLAAGHTCE